MRKCLIIAVLLFTTTVICLDAQELQPIIENESCGLYEPVFQNATGNELLMRFIETPGTCGSILKIDDEGHYIDTLYFWPKEKINEVVWVHSFDRNDQGEPCVFFLTYKNDSSCLHLSTIHDDFSVSRKEYGKWESPNYWEPYDSYASTNAVLNKDGSAVLSFPLENPFFYPLSLRVMRFDGFGNICAETTLESPHCHRPFMLSSLDSVGCRVIMRCPESTSDVIYDCFLLDADLNVIAQKHNIDNLAYPVLSCYYPANLRYNPITGKAYSINTFSIPAMNGNPAIYEDIFMSAFDEGFNQINYAWGIHDDERSFAAQYINGSIGFGTEGDVYMIGTMDPLNDGALGKNLYIVQFDENLNKLGEIYYQFENESVGRIPLGICCNGKDCVFCLDNISLNPVMGWHAVFKLPKESFDNIEEAHTQGFAVATAYPNPGKDVLNIRTGLRDAWVEVYDVNGRLIHRQALTDNVTAIDAGDWAEGFYVWKVYTSNGGPSTLRLGSATTGSVIEAESGKWIKE
jgi:hypothetical protein